VANYATWNPLINGDSATSGNLNVTNDTARGTQELLKYDAYWEITSTGGTTTAGVVSGTGTTNTTTVADTKTYGFRLTTTGTLDYINITDGGSFTNITTGLTSQQFPYASAASATTGSFNAGQRPFAATPPSGFKALNTFNLPDSTIKKGNTVMDATTYTGTNVSNAIVNQGAFKPDLVWIKARSVVSYHGLIDSVRGRAFSLPSNATDAEGTSSATQDLVSFNSNGFTVGVGSQFNSNGSGNTLVGWQWQAGQGTNTTNTNGSITSTVSVNATAGFSIVTYTGTGANATVGHGLGVAPKMIIAKSRATAGTNWGVWHTSLTNYSYFVLLNTTAAQATAANSLQALPSSTVVSLGSSSIFNDAANMVMYCWAEIAGFSAFGSYTGNGSSDGVFVYTGFRPKFIIIKCTSNADSWYMLDTSRSPYNTANQRLFADLSAAESIADNIDILSNGFKNRSSTTLNNLNGGTYIYMAFAENPFKNANAR
jgi:hypothetical protein